MQDFATRRTVMVDTQVRPNDVTKFPIIAAMLHVPREQFVPAAKREAAYIGENLELAPGRVLLEPRNFAKMLDALDIQPDDLVLDVGAGLGYSSAVIARMAEAVVALEDGDMASQAEAALAEAGADNVAVVTGALTEGAAQHGPYDAILIEGAVEAIPPALIEQLKEGGRIAAIFMEGALGIARIGYKIDGAMSWRDLFNGTAPVLPGFVQPREFVL
ncbi:MULTISPECIES: protein-L-isoaspartate O-methyltransferase family protein [Thioclava]|uniref:protein-L-isoaspartate O-methyltransferase family protein n=1 Tax=Thioclava TaxID=285107 RepID=UPI000B53E9DD|nr:MULTISPECIES: protein-L-isoaspartate O-methyltransferase [Thioclava]OWY03355.1 protein-L-isoaspartate O-methyltransferase [Thioclava sp. IC9]OWY03558.1 protein-L-isoaspartate O-methyltransferase [Thioclava sp. F1Mire-8]OWY09519.1 protein-L-isoaspartate O-methyltransferase [Thioclava sp. F42-5]OWY14365.1 protein-L-isoaspartate O-methyltransferase [Thioclava sp. F34-6]OWY16009.1 protein-L-isoaspartate O-methyltransferase [Thioclava sp. JM3]